jgi:hypothetical protein
VTILCLDRIYSEILLQCIGLGRPPSIRLSYIDTELPADVGAVDSDGAPLTGCEYILPSSPYLLMKHLVYRWKHEFVKDCYSDVIEATLTALPPKYDEILDLDRRIREKPLPSHLNKVHQPTDEQFITPRVYFQSNLLGQYRSVSE